MVYTINGFEWNLVKAESNFRKHGVRFEDAAMVFYDPNAIILADLVHSTHFELREHGIGEHEGRVLFVVFTVRPPDRKSRIISARLANRKEKAKYDEAKKSKI